MGTTADKLQAILNSKRAIKEALIAKGAAITEQTKFSQYATVISQMSTGSSDIGDAYVVVEEDGVLKAQRLSLDGTTASPDGATETIGNVGLFATGMNEPAYNGSGTGGSAKYYKCASVNTSEKTWNGYELVLQDGIYVVSDTETTGLTYAGFTPAVNTMYNEDATFIISNLFSNSETLEGCIFAANMQTNEAYYNGNTITLDEVNLVAAPVYTDGTKALNASDYSIDFDGKSLFANNKVSFALSFYYDSQNSAGNLSVIELRDIEDDGSGAGVVRLDYNGINFYGPITARLGKTLSGLNPGYGWHHIVLTSNNSKVIGYCDGIQFATGDDNGYGVPSDYEKLYLRTACYRNNVYLKDVQVYNRVLDAAEVEDLYTKAKLPTA